MDLDTVIARLRGQGRQKITPQRIEILRSLIQAAQPISAQEVHDEVTGSFPGVSLDTVYRNLMMLSEEGLVTPINLAGKGPKLFEFNDGNHHHHHAVCLRCGATFCIDSCHIELAEALPEGDPGFRITGHVMEVYGICGKCASS